MNYASVDGRVYDIGGPESPELSDLLLPVIEDLDEFIESIDPDDRLRALERLQAWVEAKAEVV